MADDLRQPCPRAEAAEGVHTVGDLAAFSVRQEAALSICEARRSALLDTVDAHNALVAEVAAGGKPHRGPELPRSGR